MNRIGNFAIRWVELDLFFVAALEDVFVIKRKQNFVQFESNRNSLTLREIFF